MFRLPGNEDDRRRRRCCRAAAGRAGAAAALRTRVVGGVAGTRRVDVRMCSCMQVHCFTPAMSSTLDGFIVRVREGMAARDRRLMRGGRAMLQCRRIHTLERECCRDDPEQQESSEFGHAHREVIWNGAESRLQFQCRSVSVASAAATNRTIVDRMDLSMIARSTRGTSSCSRGLAGIRVVFAKK
jgi:hypothetical protein